MKLKLAYLTIMILLLGLFSIPSCTDSGANSENPSKDTSSPAQTVLISSSEVLTFTDPRLSYYSTSGGGGEAGQICRQVLQNGVMQIYRFENYQDFKAAFRKAIRLDETVINTLDESKAASLGVSLPVAKALAAFNADYSSNKEVYQELRRKYSLDEKLEISERDMLKIEMMLGDQTIVKAWETCVKTAFDSQRGIRSFTSGDELSNFAYNLNYYPRAASDPKKIKIVSVTTSPNLKLVGEKNLVAGNALESFTGLAQGFQRTDKNTPAFIRVNFEGVGPDNLTLDAYVEPPKTAIYEEQWFNTNEDGVPYSQYFSVPLPQCKKCSGKPAIPVDVTLELIDKEVKIINYSQPNEAAGVCAWTWARPGVPVFETSTSDPYKFTFRYASQGPPCSIGFTVYYSKKRKVCIKNCEVEVTK